MREAFGDIWSLAVSIPYSVVIITTNGTVKKNKALVMGKGIAKEALDRYPKLDVTLGHHVRQRGNTPMLAQQRDGLWLATMPTKYDWRTAADIELIIDSAKELQEILPLWAPERTFLMPRPGCGNGDLDWAVVKSFIEPILCDQFVVCSWFE